MNATAALWLMNAVLAVCAATWTSYVVRARSRRGRHSRSEILDIAVATLDDIPAEAELRAAWSTVLATCTGLRNADDINLVRVAALYDSDVEAVEELRSACRKYINKVNDLAELVDDGLVRPKDICRLYPELHLALLVCLHLIEPMIWYDSAVNARGRWGYRPARLRAVLEALRPVSGRTSLHSKFSIEVMGLNLGQFDEISTMRLMAMRLWLKIHSPTIDMAGKRRQAAYAERLASGLRDLGISISRPEYVIKAVEW